MPEWKPEILRRLAPLELSPTRQAEIAEELAQHLEDRYQELLATGQSENAAFRTAIDELKGEDFLARNLRPVERDLYREPIVPGKGSTNFFSGVLQDIRFAVRMLRKSPGFTAVAILTLALGIGANTAIFTLVHSVMLQSLPVKNPSELYRLGEDADDCCDITGTQGDFSIFSTALYKQIRDNTPEFSELAAFQPQPGSVILRRSSSAGGRSTVQEFVSGNYFRTFGVSASLGRMLTPADDQPEATPVAVMSYHAWHELYAGDPSVVGSSLLVDTIPFTVVGVARRAFTATRCEAIHRTCGFPFLRKGSNARALRFRIFRATIGCSRLAG
jgi:MacB-like periplasmic core domain